MNSALDASRPPGHLDQAATGVGAHIGAHR
jgi:hypothetical protein